MCLPVLCVYEDVHHNSLYDNVINNQNVIIFTNNAYIYRQLYVDITNTHHVNTLYRQTTHIDTHLRLLYTNKPPCYFLYYMYMPFEN